MGFIPEPSQNELSGREPTQGRRLSRFTQEQKRGLRQQAACHQGFGHQGGVKRWKHVGEEEERAGTVA